MESTRVLNAASTRWNCARSTESIVVGSGEEVKGVEAALTRDVGPGTTNSPEHVTPTGRTWMAPRAGRIAMA
jgi:hypothetical protein